MSAEETRTEHVMIRLKPAEKALLEAKAKERGMKPTQLAYEALLGMLSAKYTPEQMAEAIDDLADEVSGIHKELREINKRLEKVDPEPPDDYD